jgi:hypothetical protein
MENGQNDDTVCFRAEVHAKRESLGNDAANILVAAVIELGQDDDSSFIRSEVDTCRIMRSRLGNVGLKRRAVAYGLFGQPLRVHARRKVHHQSFSHPFLMHDDSPLRHRAGEAIVPSSHDGFVAPQRYSVVCGRRQVVRGSETPGLRPEFTHHEIADDQASPIEISVIAQSGTGGGELGEQGLLGG